MQRIHPPGDAAVDPVDSFCLAEPEADDHELTATERLQGCRKGLNSRVYPMDLSAPLLFILSLFLVAAPGLVLASRMQDNGLPQWAALLAGNGFSLSIVWVFATAALGLLWKRWKLGRERRTTDFLCSHVLPDLLDAPLVPGPEQCLEHMEQETILHGRKLHSDNLLWRRLSAALSSAAAEAPADPASDEASFEDDRKRMGSSFWIIDLLAWALPVLGFMGTVWGISAAVGGFSTTFQEISDAKSVARTLEVAVPRVTSRLSIAFDTTFLALLLSLPLMLLAAAVRKKEERYLADLACFWRGSVAPWLRRLSDVDHRPALDRATSLPSPREPGSTLQAELRLLTTQVAALEAVVNDYGQEIASAARDLCAYEPEEVA